MWKPLILSVATLVAVSPFLPPAPRAAATESDGSAVPVPWQSALIRDGDLTQLHTISTEADVTVSDGLEFTVVTHSRGPQRTVFHSVYPDGRTTLGKDGHYIWMYNGREEKEGEPFFNELIQGHQFHAVLFFLPSLHGATPESPPSPGESGCECMTQSFANESGTRYRYQYNKETLLPIGSTTSLTDGTNIDVLYNEWREVDGFYLPHHIQIDDGTRVFDYRYTSIRFNQDGRADFRAPYDSLTDRQKLIRLHVRSMDAHLDSDASLMNDQWADEVVIVSEGEIYRQSREDAEAFMTRSLNGRRHQIYEDLELPHIEISQDGTLGTVTARVRAVGRRVAADGKLGAGFRFVSAWTSVFQKQNGRWRLISNTSNFEPVD